MKKLRGKCYDKLANKILEGGKYLIIEIIIHPLFFSKDSPDPEKVKVNKKKMKLIRGTVGSSLKGLWDIFLWINFLFEDKGENLFDRKLIICHYLFGPLKFVTEEIWKGMQNFQVIFGLIINLAIFWTIIDWLMRKILKNLKNCLRSYLRMSMASDGNPQQQHSASNQPRTS